ncbi:DUF2520 domain-containing protein [Leucobacter sp. W1038]|uniref:DUF2520 domain-containing protein n=1 Tax=Leucobacter sp. W1038 TaxID=3438281 RepID=UPI003D99440C
MCSTDDLRPRGAPGLGNARVRVVGAGRVGTAIARSLRQLGIEVSGPAGRGDRGEKADIVLLAVPDSAIRDAARLITPGALVGHFSGATELSPLAPHEAFSLHPLTSVADAAHDFRGGFAAIDGTTPRAEQTARDLADLLGMRSFWVRDADRAAYHAAASIAANFLVTIEGAAEQLAKTAGVGREALVPLVRSAVENWAERGAAEALTGPIARGDSETVARQRHAVAERTPEHLPLFDALAAATQHLADPSRSGEHA